MATVDNDIEDRMKKWIAEYYRHKMEQTKQGEGES